MMQRYAVVQQIVALARLPDARSCGEVERELRAHLDDLTEEARSQGYDEAMIERIVAIRFGDPRQIAAGFASAYALERWIRRVVACGIFLLASVAAVSFAVATVQSSAALLSGIPLAESFGGFPWELLGACAIALSYCGAYLAECVFPGSTAKAVSLTTGLAFCLAACLSLIIPAHALLPCVAIASAAFARTLQRVPLPALWFAGTAGPPAIAWLAFHPLLAGQAPPPWLLWAGLTLSCAALRQVVSWFETLVFRGTFAQRPPAACAP
jgi:hypothetical protein